MRRLSAFLLAYDRPGQDQAALLAAIGAKDPAVVRFLTEPAPQPLVTPATLRAWIVEETALPDWLIDTSRRATGDLAETLALILPHPNAPEPTLEEVLADLTGLPPGPLAKPAILAMARRLPAAQRTLYFRLITGTFRSPVTVAVSNEAQGLIAGGGPRRPAATHQILTVMIYAEAGLASGAVGPELTLAVWDQDRLAPIARARANLPAPQVAALMTWIRAEATGRFGPLRAVPARQVFRLGFTGLSANRRRQSGVTLTDPAIVEWLTDAVPAEAGHLSTLAALLVDTA